MSQLEAVWKIWGAVSRENSNKKQEKLVHCRKEWPPRLKVNMYLRMNKSLVERIM